MYGKGENISDPNINEKKEPLIGNCNDALVLMKTLEKIYKEN